jgi:hypothetical protein
MQENNSDELTESLQECWYCKVNRESSDHSVNKSMYGNVTLKDANYIGFGETQVKQGYNTVKIGVPRCQSCFAKHRNHGLIGCVTVVACGLATVGFLAWLHHSNGGEFEFDFPGSICFGAFLFGVGALVGLIPAAILKSVFKPDIPPENQILEYPAIKRLLQHGWKIGNKPSHPDEFAG